MSVTKKDVRDYLAAIGARGGRAGSKHNKKRAADIRWSKHRDYLLPEPIMNEILNVHATGNRHIEGAVVPRGIPRPKRRNMTLIVGIICKDAIVFGAESETTFGYAKTQDTEKLTIVPFGDTNVIIGEAGIQNLSSAVVEEFVRSAASTQLTDRDVAKGVLERAFRSVCDRGIGPPIGSSEFQDFYRQEINYFQLTLGFYLGGVPYIYSFNPIHGLATRVYKHYVASGVCDVATYLLASFKFEKMESREAVFTAIHVVREVKTSASGCGGNIEIALVSNGNKPEKLTRETITMMESQLSDMAKVERERRKQETKNIVRGALLQYNDGIDRDSIVPEED